MIRGKEIVILAILMILFFMGSAAATENSTLINQTDLQMESTSEGLWNLTNSTDFNSTYSSSTETPEGSNLTVAEWEELSGCCSVLIHVRAGYDVFAYRRDSTYAATQYIQHISWYGKEALKEFKNVNGYFFHTIVSANGWIASMGGSDVLAMVNQMESLAGSTSVTGSITSSTINTALNLLRSYGMGHFVIKDPNGVVGFAIYNGGGRTGLFQMGNGQYISVPNSPGAYRTGYISTSDPVYSALSLENSDSWGWNRRNIIVYEFFKDVQPGSSLVNVYAARTKMSDTIVFGSAISGGSLPTSPNRRYLGQVLLKYYEPTYFGYQAMTYMYSDILDSYIKTGVLPSNGGMIPWKILSNPNAGPYTNEQVVAAAKTVKNYIDTNHKLPSTVTINGKSVSIYTYFYLATTVVQNLNSKNSKNMYISTYGAPQQTKDTISAGNMGLAEYIKIADQVKVYMDRTGITPGYAYGTSLGTYFGYGSMIYMYSAILGSYNKTGILPASIGVIPLVAAFGDKNYAAAGNIAFTNNQVVLASKTVKNYMETNYKLPSTVNINGQNVSIYTYLHLASTVVQNLYSKNSQNVYAGTDNPPQLTNDNIRVGNMGIAEYIKIADQVKVYMDRTGITPGYAYGTSLGTYFGYGSMIYMYSAILDSYNKTGALPNSVLVKPWKILSNPNAGPYTNKQVVEAGKKVKEYIDTNHQLPNTVNINGHNVSIYTYLHLASTVVQNLYSKNSQNVYAVSDAAPQISHDTIRVGNMGIAEYIKIADQVKVYMDRTGITPGYAYGTSLGTYFGYGSMIYMYSAILDSYNKTGALPNSVLVKPWKILSNPNAGPYTNKQVATAGSWVKNYVDTNHNLPGTVQINGKSVSIYTYFYLASTVVQNLYSNNPQDVYAINYAAPEKTKDTINIGNMSKSQYIKIADQVKVYMDRTGITPGYALI